MTAQDPNGRNGRTYMPSYRFFFHYRKQTKRLSIHFKKICYTADDVLCKVPCESKWHNRQPHLTMQGYAHTVDITTDPDTNRVLAHIQ